MTARRRRAARLGLLSGDLQRLAAAIHEDLTGGDRVVWARDGWVWMADVSIVPQGIATDMVAGTFRFGQPINDLIDDLACLRESLQLSDSAHKNAGIFPSAESRMRKPPKRAS